MLTIAHTSTPPQIHDVRDLIREYTDWAFSSTTGSATAPTFADLEHELATLPGVYSPPEGRLFLASLDGEPAGCIALRRHDATTGEIKRLYVRPGFRGHNIGGRLVAALLAAAREIGYRRLVLDSHRTMTHAHQRHAAVGFQVVEPPEDVPEDIKQLAIFMELDLAL